MNTLGEKIAARRRELGITQLAFAEKLYVTRQTVGRWEQGVASPDVETLVQIAELLDVSCDYLLRDDVPCTDAPAVASTYTPAAPAAKPLCRLLAATKGRRVKLACYDGEYDPDLLNRPCTILDFEGNWVRVQFQRNKRDEACEKLLALSSVFSIELLEDEEV